MDFSNYLFHCSSLGLIMTDPRGKSNRDKYEELKINVAKVRDKYNKLDDEYFESRSNGIALSDVKFENLGKTMNKLNSLNAQLKQLEIIKDENNLSETCKRHLIRLFVKERYGRVDDIKVKYLEKGKFLEEDAITIYARLT